MLLLRFVDGEAKMMSIPRDLYVPIAETGGSQKINAAYNGGPRRLVQTVQQSLGVPIHQYLEVDFVSFAKLVDALGGITIDFPHPAFDRNSGLDVRQAGPVELNGAQALAFVRSRHYVEVIDGEEVPDATRRPRPGACASSSSSRPSSASWAASRTRSPWPARRAARPGVSASTTPSASGRRSGSPGASAPSIPRRSSCPPGSAATRPARCCSSSPSADAALAQFR